LPDASAPLKQEAENHSFRILAILSMLMAFASISTDFYLPAMPVMRDALHAGKGAVELTISSYLIGFSLGQLVWGPVSDRWGRRGPIAIGLVLFVIGSAGCAMSTSVTMMISWRVLQAVGACASVVLARAMVSDLYEGSRAAQMLSTFMMVMAIAPLIGPSLGGQILYWFSWQAIFWTLVGVGVATLAALFVLPETLPPGRRHTEPLGKAFYGLLFGAGAIGVMLSNLINARLVKRLGSDALMRAGSAGAALTSIWLALDAWTDWGGLFGLAIPLFLFVSTTGFIVANSIAGALNLFPQRAGAVSALVGSMQYGTGVLGSALVGFLADGTPRPMGGVVAVLGVSTLLCARFLVPRRLSDW